MENLINTRPGAYSSSLRRRAILLRTVAAAAVLQHKVGRWSGSAQYRCIQELLARVSTHASWYAPPACVFLQPTQVQMPTETLFTLSRPQNTQLNCNAGGCSGSGRFEDCCFSRRSDETAETCLAVLCDLDLSDEFPQRCTEARSVLAGDADFLCALAHLLQGSTMSVELELPPIRWIAQRGCEG
jgi:hypothetical protein